MKQTSLILITIFLLVIVPDISLAQDECESKPVKIHGSSLAPFVKNGSEIMMKPASCSGTIKTDDFVIFETGAHDMPVIKIVKAVSGDDFAIENGYIIVNGDKQQTSLGEYYRLRSGKDKMLRLYQDSFGGVVPKDTYLVLGDHPSGSLDSSRIGFIHWSDILMVGRTEDSIELFYATKEEK